MNAAGIILCGGKSTRMGRPKAWLPVGNEPMLARVVRILSECLSPICVVAAKDQPIPPLPSSVLVAIDERPDRGPLEGLLAGLTAIESKASVAYASSCDTPLLTSAFVRTVVEKLEDSQIAVPVDEQFHHPLASAYTTSVIPIIRELLAADRLRPVFLYEQAKTHRIPVNELRAVDPDLGSLQNLNYPADYLAALERLGIAPTDY